MTEETVMWTGENVNDVIDVVKGFGSLLFENVDGKKVLYCKGQEVPIGLWIVKADGKLYFAEKPSDVRELLARRSRFERARASRSSSTQPGTDSSSTRAISNWRSRQKPGTTGMEMIAIADSWPDASLEMLAQLVLGPQSAMTRRIAAQLYVTRQERDALVAQSEDDAKRRPNERDRATVDVILWLRGAGYEDAADQLHLLHVREFRSMGIVAYPFAEALKKSTFVGPPWLNTGKVEHVRPGATVTHDGYQPMCPLCREEAVDMIHRLVETRQ